MKKEVNGLPVVDAKKPIKIVVKLCDLQRSNPKEPKSCVIARAVGRELHPKGVMAHLSRMYINYDNKAWVRYLTPGDARQELVSFDRGGSFHPGEFVFVPPRPSKRLSGKRAGGNKDAAYKKSGRKRRRYHLTANVRKHA